MFHKSESIEDESANSNIRWISTTASSSGATRIPKNKSENSLTIQVPNLLDNIDSLDEGGRKAHSSPIRHPQRRRYSQGAVLVGPRYSVLTGELVNSSSSSSAWSSYDVDYVRHSSENLRELIQAEAANPFASTIHLLEHESMASGGSISAPEHRKKNQKTPQERLNKLAKRHWPDDHLIPLDDICESPLVKTPNEPATWSAGHHSVLQQHSTTNTLFADSLSAGLQLDKG